MRISKYTLTLKEPKNRVLFNSLSRYEIEIDNELLKAIRDREFHRIDDQIRSELIEMGFIVSDDHDEKRELIEFLSDETSQTKTLDVTFALTFNCNMSCSYCVQRDFKNEEECNDEMFIKWLSNCMETANPKRLRVSFFGGEPLLRAESISRISSEIQKKCKSKAIEFGFCITTNGTLIDVEKIREWKRWGLFSLDVTLDGTMGSHDKTRVYKNGGGTFTDILCNLRSLNGLVPVNMICNVGGPADAYTDFIKFLTTVDVHFECIRFKPVYNREKSDFCTHNPEVTETLKTIWNKARKTSLPFDRDFIIGPCGFFANNSMAVSPSGKIYPCTPFMGKNEYQMGDISDGSKLDKKFNVLNNLPEGCIACTYCPICCGGCRFVSYKSQSDASRITCEKPFFDSIFNPL